MRRVARHTRSGAAKPETCSSASLLQVKDSSCAVGDHVKCPYSDNYCSGDQCCPGANETGGKTYPCPSASASYNQCQVASKPVSSVASVQCPYSDDMCMGNQCCPGASQTGGKTYPCPSASTSYTTCETGVAKPETCSTDAEALTQVPVKLQPIKLHVQP